MQMERVARRVHRGIRRGDEQGAVRAQYPSHAVERRAGGVRVLQRLEADDHVERVVAERERGEIAADERRIG